MQKKVVSVTVLFEPKLEQTVRILAAQLNLNRSEFIRQSVNRHIEEMARKEGRCEFIPT